MLLHADLWGGAELHCIIFTQASCNDHFDLVPAVPANRESAGAGRDQCCHLVIHVDYLNL